MAIPNCNSGKIQVRRGDNIGIYECREFDIDDCNAITMRRCDDSQFMLRYQYDDIILSDEQNNCTNLRKKFVETQ